MKSNALIATLILTAVTLPVFAQTAQNVVTPPSAPVASAPTQAQIDKAEVHNDTKAIKQDRKAVHKDVKALNKDEAKREIAQKAENADVKSGDLKDAKKADAVRRQAKHQEKKDASKAVNDATALQADHVKRDVDVANRKADTVQK